MQAVVSMRGMDISVRSTTRLQSGPDPQLLEAAQWAKDAGEGLLIRVSPSFYRPGNRGYVSWRDTSWTVEVRTPDEAVALKPALEAFFEALATGQVEALTQVLREFKQGGTQ